MPKILFIANEPGILELIESLQPLVESAIGVEADYSSGIKRIFEDQPDVVFIQNTIDNVSCEKPVSQVKALLDNESIRLILLTNEAISWNSFFSAFDQCLDTCQPPEELGLQIRLLLTASPAAASSGPGLIGTEACHPAETVEVELCIDEMEPFGEFPSEAEDAFSWEMAAPAADPPPEVDLPTLAASPEEEPPAFLASFLSGQLDDRSPSFLSADLQQEQTSSQLSSLPLGNSTPPAFQVRGAENQRIIDRQDPSELFGSLTQESSKPSVSYSDAGGLRPARQQTPPKQSSPLQQWAGGRKGSSRTSPQAAKAGPARAGVQGIPTAADQLSKAAAASIGIGKSSGSYRGIVIGALLVIGVVSTASGWLYFGQSRPAKPVSEASPASATKASGREQLPGFIPRIAPDAGYGATHPGWERYQADAVEYLVFREHGQVRAVQVVSEQQGALSVPFLKTCLRIATGLELSEINLSNERKDGIEVQTGTLANGGELAIYRNSADRELRGFVLVFPAGEAARPAGAKPAR